jgi:hypothetical protein
MGCSSARGRWQSRSNGSTLSARTCSGRPIEPNLGSGTPHDAQIEDGEEGAALDSVAGEAGHGVSCMFWAMVTLTRLITAPAERSKPPERMTSVWPIAAMASVAPPLERKLTSKEESGKG